jgi:hypothetical protein
VVEPPAEAPALETAPTEHPEVAEPAVAPASSPVVATPASGQALVALLETSISGLHDFVADAVDAPAPAAVAAPAPSRRGTSDTVPIETLVYRGRAALDRAREVRDQLRGTSAPDPLLLSELYDLLDLAVLDEPVHA